MKISAKIIAHSINDSRDELITMELTYPRFIHAEFMTHRVFSRNASSSRAIPVRKLTAMALEDPAFFVHVGTNKPGMQAGDEVPDEIREKFYKEWVELAEICSKYALRWAEDYNIHKQVVNRVMEPWHHIKVIVTGTDFSNFFTLRDHPAAQPEIRALAVAMKNAVMHSTPKRISAEEWHLPYVLPEEKEKYDLTTLLKISAARCARVSYMNHDGTVPDVSRDIKLHDDLVHAKPPHMSPVEHQATPAYGKNANLRGW
jgi:thymidylate synthase ThyX